MTNNSCEVCSTAATNRCSKCRVVFYCSAECQKKDWKKHKNSCKNQYKKGPSPPPSQQQQPQQQQQQEEMRECRCMFCGEVNQFKSEEEATAHLDVCPAFNEQMDSKEQFTLPESMR